MSSLTGTCRISGRFSPQVVEEFDKNRVTSKEEIDVTESSFYIFDK